MFDFIRGELVRKEPDFVVLEAGGIGWRCDITLNTYEQLPTEGEVLVYTYLHVTENSHGLYGFAEPEERELFQLLSSASGIGPRKAISLLSEAAPGQILRALRDENTSLLEQASGIGKKTARRLVAELQDRAEDLADRFRAPDPSEGEEELDGDLITEAVQALEELGYPGDKSRSAVRQVAGEHPDVDDPGDLVKLALKEVIQ